jgi:xanthine dehydrogenase molybdenum-binding subunit
MDEFKVVGKNVPRIDIRAKVTGHAKYAADIDMPGMVYGKVIRCMDHAHAKVKNLDFSQAEKMPGVIKVLGPDDVTSNTYNMSPADLLESKEGSELFGIIQDQSIFTRHVKFQGDGIGAIIAETEEQAERAVAKVKVDYEPLPVYLTPEQSSAPDAVQFVEEKPGNLAFQIPEAIFPNNCMGWGDVDAAFKDADVIVEDRFYTPKQKQCQMEPNTYIALYDDEGRLNCWSSSQLPKLAQIKLARLFEIPMSRITVTQTVVGGGFGARQALIMEPEVCALALAVPGRPVKILEPREEDWLSSPSRHPTDY